MAGYAVGSSTLCNGCIKCDSRNAVTSFPLAVDRAPTQFDYDAVDEPITMNFQWATRSISPSFMPGTAMIDEGSGSGATNISTLNFNNTKYNIFSVQIAAATHNRWLIPTTSQSQNTEDMIITFYNPNTSIQYNYIIIVIPILRSGTASTDPSYLAALSANSPKGNYSLSSCLPQNKKSLFAYYATCINGYTQHKTPENVYVFIAVEGIPVSSNLMNSIANGIPPSNIFPPISLPFLMNFATQISSLQVSTEFSRYVLSTRHLLNYAGIKSLFKDLSINERTDPTSAYQCVALDPDKDISGGTISFDLESGEILSNVLAERDAMRAAANVGNTKEPAGKSRVQAYLGSALGILCAILIFSILLYFILKFSISKQEEKLAAITASAAAAAAAADPTASAAVVLPSTTPAWVKQLPLYGIMVVVAGLIGFTVGAAVS